MPIELTLILRHSASKSPDIGRVQNSGECQLWSDAIFSKLDIEMCVNEMTRVNLEESLVLCVRTQMATHDVSRVAFSDDTKPNVSSNAHELTQARVGVVQIPLTCLCYRAYRVHWIHRDVASAGRDYHDLETWQSLEFLKPSLVDLKSRGAI